MKLADFKYPLDRNLIAQEPLEDRAQGKLLILKRKSGLILHHKFSELKKFLYPGDILVLNNTKVFKARLIGHKESGAKIEILLLEKENELWKAMIFPARKVKPEMKIFFGDNVFGEVKRKEFEKWLISFNQPDDEIIRKFGIVPLPHYIKRKPELKDEVYYQTVYAKKIGSIAAPTAGLHFTETIIEDLKNYGVKIAEITLHIGPGTFKPIRTEEIEKHRMEPEYFEVSRETTEEINKAKRVIAVGTSVVRTLESIAGENQRVDWGPISGRTELFIFPGYKFKVVDCLITNFHLPCSTPLLLVCAFATRELIFNAYNEAMEKKYRFLSYGDAMLII
uniref:S-adenosylmethionine:tRNA ribosyltransferase-isomerase n=1 Tax=candidate division WOR-3 bacterium TaxID=2052148 RepID=A0A7C4TBS5_UNCW3